MLTVKVLLNKELHEFITNDRSQNTRNNLCLPDVVLYANSSVITTQDTVTGILY